MSVLAVGMREFAFATDSITLTTSGIKTCLGIAVYDSISKKALLMHVDSMSNFDQVEQLLNKMHQTSKIYILTTENTTELETMVEYLKLMAFDNVTVDKKLYALSSTLSIDSKTGDIKTDNVDKSKIIYHSKFKDNMDNILQNIDCININLLSGVEGYDDSFIFTPNKGLLYALHLKNKYERKIKGLMKNKDGTLSKCTECNYVGHTFVCSFAKKCTECGQRIDIDNEWHPKSCSQHKVN